MLTSLALTARRLLNRQSSPFDNEKLNRASSVMSALADSFSL